MPYVEICHMIAPCLLTGQVTADRRVMKNTQHTPADSSSDIRRFVTATSLSNADSKLASTADSTFESALNRRNKADSRPKFQHISTDCSRLTEFTPTSR